MAIHSTKETIRKCAEWNKETQRLMDLEIFGGGGGISPIHPECAYPDEKYVSDNEIYLIVDATSTNDILRINRIAVKGGGVGVEFGYIDQNRKFVNRMKEWGYTEDKLIFDESDPNNHAEFFFYAQGKDAYTMAMYLEIGIGLAKKNCNRPSFCVKLTTCGIDSVREKKGVPYNCNKGSFDEFMINTKFTWNDHSFTVNDDSVNVLIKLIIMKASSIRIAQPANISSLLYCIVLTDYTGEIFPTSNTKKRSINFSLNDSLRYAIYNQPIDYRIYSNCRIFAESQSSVLGGLFGNDTSLLRSCFIDFPNIHDLYCVYTDCPNLTKDGIPHENGVLNINMNWSEGDNVRLNSSFRGCHHSIEELSFRIDNCNSVDMGYMFREASITTNPKFEFLSDNSTVNAERLFVNVIRLIPNLAYLNEIFKRATNTSMMFYTVSLGLSDMVSWIIDLPLTTNVNLMFERAIIPDNIVVTVNAPQCLTARSLFRSTLNTHLQIVNLPECTDISEMYSQTTSLSKQVDATITKLSDYINAPKVTTLASLFNNSNIDGDIDLQGCFPIATNYSAAFYNCNRLTGLLNNDWTNVTTVDNLVNNSDNFIRIDNAHTMRNVTNFASAFRSTQIADPYTLGDPDPTHAIDTSSAIDMSYMYSGCFSANEFGQKDSKNRLLIPSTCNNATSLFYSSNIHFVIIEVESALTNNTSLLYEAFSGCKKLEGLAIKFADTLKFTKDQDPCWKMFGNQSTTFENSADRLPVKIYIENPGVIDDLKSYDESETRNSRGFTYWPLREITFRGKLNSNVYKWTCLHNVDNYGSFFAPVFFRVIFHECKLDTPEVSNAVFRYNQLRANNVTDEALYLLLDIYPFRKADGSLVSAAEYNDNVLFDHWNGMPIENPSVTSSNRIHRHLRTYNEEDWSFLSGSTLTFGQLSANSPLVKMYNNNSSLWIPEAFK